MAEPQASAQKEDTEPIENSDEYPPTYLVFVQLPNGDKIELPMGSTDTLMEVRQFLSDAPQSCWMTSYSLHHNGKELSEIFQLSELGDATLAARPVFMMKEVPYNEHSARMHVRRLRELLESLTLPDKSPSVFTQLDSFGETETEEDKATMIAEFEKPVTPLLSKFYPNVKAERVNPSALVRSIAFSGWNPPPGNRRLQGDLFYLEVKTVESKSLFITASVSGFFVNQSSEQVFNPAQEKSAKKVHNLVDLLRSSSAAFTKGFAALLEHEFSTAHPFEMLPVPLPVAPWALRSKKHSYELNRIDDTALAIDPPGLVRDWNEEFQACFEQPKTETQDRILRDRNLIKTVSEFLETATRGAVAIVHKNVLPLNALEPEKTHMWMYSNIFFSAATDVRDQYAKWGGEATAFKAVRVDLNAANRLFQLALPEVRPVLTAVIDYRGYRLTAQAIIPGIMQNTQVERVVYGSPEPGKAINVDPAFRDALVPVCKEFYLAEHTFKDPATGKNVTLQTSCDSKGVLGADGRRYFLDLSRLLPRDSNFKDDPRRLLAVHRLELMLQFEAFYTRFVDEDAVKKTPLATPLTDVEKRVLEQMRLANPKLVEHIKERKQQVLAMMELNKQTDNSERMQELRKLQEKVFAPSPHLEFGFNADYWGPVELDASPEERAKQEDLLNAAGFFVKERLITELINDWAAGINGAPIDGQHLTVIMHRSGVPMRYLGELATRTKTSIPYVSNVATLEMVARAAKHLFTATLKSTTDDSTLALTISHFLNALLGKREHEDKKKKGANDAKAPAAAAVDPQQPARMTVSLLTTTALWETIARVIKEEYGYVIVPANVRSTIARLALLRGLCIKVGLQVAARDYDFAAEHPFSPTDVLDLFPVAKTLQPRSLDGTARLEEGRYCLSHGKMEEAFENLTEALAIFHQVYGPMHVDTATCYSNLGQLLLHGDTKQAAVHQRKAVIIHERVSGLDHFETISAYHQLASFASSSNHVVQSLRFTHRAMSLSALVSVGQHPEYVQYSSNIALMLHECGAVALALRYMEEALRMTESAPDGANSEQTAAVCHLLAFIHGANGDSKEALAYEKKTYYIYKEKYGEQHQRTQDANTWLKQFTAQAVQNRRETTKQAEEFVAAAWSDPQVRRFVQNQLGATLGTGRPSAADMSRIVSVLGNAPETLARVLQRGANAMAENGGAAGKAAPGEGRTRMGRPRRK